MGNGSGRILWLGPLIAVVIGSSSSCGDGGPVPFGTLAAESRHFRLFVARDYDVSGARVGTATVDDVIEGLETNWRDTATLLGTPEGKIDYYLLRAEQIDGACEVSEAAACELGGTVYSTSVMDQHELNHAYMELLSAHQPAALLVEGVADAIGCTQGAIPQGFSQIDDWRNLIAYSHLGQVYAGGREFSRYLIVKYGIDRFLSYYRQGPDTRDPKVFSDNFVSFWSMDLDTAWADMQVAQPAWGPIDVYPLCPCSLPPFTASTQQTQISQGPGHPYWTWPVLEGDTAVFQGYRGSVAIRDCRAQDLDNFTGFGAMFARLDGPLYADISGALVSRGKYVSEICADAEVFALSSQIVSAGGGTPMGIAVTRPSSAPFSVYLFLQVSVPTTLSFYEGSGVVNVCPSCNSTAADCQTLSAQSKPVLVNGSFVLRWDAPASSWPYSYASVWVGPG